tara:strand:- start:193 stop:1299 length:1107 start_codon:yes stop_codon:yes gene_type:complete
MKNIAIVFLGDFFYDARCINMALSLKKQYTVFVFCPYQEIHSHKSFDKINFVQIQLSHRGIFRYWEHFYQTLRALNQYSFDTIVAGDLYSLASAVYAKQKKHILYDCREIYSALAAHQYRPMHRCLLSLYEKYFLKYVNKVLVTAETDLNYLKKKYSRYTNLDWQIIYNYPANYSPQIKQNLHKYYRIPSDNKIILYQGVISRGRGIGQLIKLIEKTNIYSAVIVGGGTYKQYYADYALSLNISHRVHFVDKVPYLKLFEYTAACDVGWSVIGGNTLSYKFALPNKLFEYLLSNLPVVASNLPNLKKIIKNYSVGELVDSYNLDQQIKAVNKLFEEKNSPVNYKNIARKYFTWDVQHNKFLQIINQLK